MKWNKLRKQHQLIAREAKKADSGQQRLLESIAKPTKLAENFSHQEWEDEDMGKHENNQFPTDVPEWTKQKCRDRKEGYS